ncbi:MAG: hypothetical protein LBI06_08225 [Treponema sp.]|nr:hypothetical protein [Treponema sp.]
MSDGGEKRRPNAKYKLSKENAREDDIVFHYSRDSRLQKAPQSVKDLYKVEPPRRKLGLLGPLVRTKGLAMMFFSIVVICIFMLAISFLGLAGSSYTLDGNLISVQATKYEGTALVVLKKSPRKNFLARFSRAVSPPYTGAVDIAVQPSLKNGDSAVENIFYHKVFFTLDPTEYYRFVVPFDAEELALVMNTERNYLRVIVKTEQAPR